MLNEHSEMISKCRHETNNSWKVTIIWTKTSDAKSRFLEIFEVSGRPIHCRFATDLQKLRLSQDIARTDVFAFVCIAYVVSPLFT